MENDNIHKTAGQMTENLLQALRKIRSGNGNIYRGEFDRLFEMGLVDLMGITDKGRAVCAFSLARPTRTESNHDQ